MIALSNHRKVVKKGETLMTEGETCTGFYLLEKGRLEVTVKGQVVGSIDTSQGQEFVGEVAALLGTPRTATVEATTECTVIWLPITQLDDVLVTCPSLGVKLARSLAKKLFHSADVHRQLGLNQSHSDEDAA